MDKILAGMTTYFSHNPYRKWFNRWAGGLAGRDFCSGIAAHTDILSPYTAKKGFGILTGGLKGKLIKFGVPMWQKVTSYAQNVKLIIGFGSQTLKQFLAFGHFEGDRSFDNIADSKVQIPWLYRGSIVLPDSKEISAVVWLPYRGNPLEWMNASDRERFSRFCRAILGEN